MNDKIAYIAKPEDKSEEIVKLLKEKPITGFVVIYIGPEHQNYKWSSQGMSDQEIVFVCENLKYVLLKD